ncbi:hypothetical protein L917_18638 [Phytophthora nicotianae]|uniref:PiggyBac transposable element-derived protein domain-containing protein n=1 Tax=Phytophthora nicotianae TaxID=4792 RepID=W2K8P5_PHYNI|nr:hypothetical protein L917_18638 [Phytophthora nicotianae]
MPASLGKPVFCARDQAFRSVWRELKAEGANPNGTEGVDFFLGLEAVLDFYARNHDGDSDDSTDGSTIDTNTSFNSEEPVRLTTPTLCPTTPTTPTTRMTTPPSIVTTTLTSSQTAVATPMATPTRSAPSRLVLIPTSPHVGISADEDTAEDGTGDDDTGDENSVFGEGDSAGEYGAQIASDEDEVDFGAMDSGDDAAQDDQEPGEDGEIVPDLLVDDGKTVAPEPTEMEITDEILLAGQFLERLGGQRAVLADNREVKALGEMSSTGWEAAKQPDTHEYMQLPYAPVSNRGSYPGLRQGRHSSWNVWLRPQPRPIPADLENLHFNPNNHELAKKDRAWKIRKIVEVVQTTFECGYVAPSHLALDEAILPSRSSFNKTRVYLKDTPHKWGTKMFVLCSAVTAYCIRYDYRKWLHCAFYKHKEEKPMSHVVYMKTLHLQLCQLQALDIYEGNQFGAVIGNTSASGTTDHRKQRWCCTYCPTSFSVFEVTSTYYCNECNKFGPIFLCLRSHRKVRGVAATCWDIWHRDWKYGCLIPVEYAGKFRVRPPGCRSADDQSTGERTPTPKKRRRTCDASDDE